MPKKEVLYVEICDPPVYRGEISDIRHIYK